jgi:hypothetical protein
LIVVELREITKMMDMEMMMTRDTEIMTRNTEMMMTRDMEMMNVNVVMLRPK